MGFTRFTINAAICACIGLGAATARAQVVTNLPNPIYEFAANVTETSFGTGQDLGQAFSTGLAATFLQSLTIRTADFHAVGHGFAISLFSDNGSGAPLAPLPVTFSGDTTPIDPGDYTYTANSAFILNPNTTYWAVLSVQHDGGPTQLYIAQTLDSSETGQPGWSIGNSVAVMTTISFGTPVPPWQVNAGYSLYLAVNAIPVPEPATATLTLLGVGGVMAQRLPRRRRDR